MSVVQKENRLLLPFLLLKFAVPFLLSHPVYELHRDEFLYYEQGQHLALGYLENPPLIGLLAALSALLGGSVFWIKFWPALFGAATLWLTLLIVKELRGGTFATFLAALGLLFTAYLRTHFLFQPNFLDIFFWTLAAYFLLRYINTSSDRYLYFLSAALAVGWYGKYSVLFFIAALLLSLLLTQYRTVFLKKHFWWAMALGVALVLPNVLWQYHHNWPLLHHMKELRETQLNNLNSLDFLKEQVLMLLPVAALWMGGLVWLLKHPDYRIIGYCFIAIILLIMTGSGKGYYALGAYPMVIAAGGVWAQRVSVQRRWLRITFVSIILLLALPFIPILLPVQKPEAMAAFNKNLGLDKLGLLRWEDGENHPLQQDFADMLGWKEITAKTEALWGRQPNSVKDATVVYAANYGLAGGLKYYATNDNFRNKVVSENGTFLLWTPYQLRFKHLIYVDDEMPEKEDDVLQYFSTMHIVDSCTNRYSRQYGVKIIYFKNAGDSAWMNATRDLQTQKAKFSR